jgi:maltooligosyltrehalose trehalohydrolase
MANTAKRLTTHPPLGATVLPTGGVQFRVWAPRCHTVDVVFEGDPQPPEPVVPLEPGADGYFCGIAAGARAGMCYRFRLDGGDRFPDPASRFQPDGPHFCSQIVDPTTFVWTDHAWRGVELAGQVLYEMHIGTFTQEGTWTAAREELPALADIGITVLEVMPIADFSGRFGWGYDGVNFFAPTRLYGTPDDMRAFVNRAHELGLGVILDVVYNHFGPDGNYLSQFSNDYISRRHTSEWGDAFNFDGPHSAHAREFVRANVRYWIEEFHVDGFRLDATQQIYDDSETHILAEIARTAREAAGKRSIILIAENEPQDTNLVRPVARGGYGLDGLWNDDFHHSAMVAMTGRSEAYYCETHGRPQELISAAKYGFLYQGQRYEWQRAPRGKPGFDLPPATFVTFIQNHDQVANSAVGVRCHELSHPGDYRAMTALLLLTPGTPMLFQGQEFAASSRFFYFADHKPELAKLVQQGRSDFLAQFPSIAAPATRRLLADPGDPTTFVRSKLDHSERAAHEWAVRLHRDLLRLRRETPAFNVQRRHGVDGAVLTDQAFVLRFFGADGVDRPDEDDRLLVINLGRDLSLVPAPEPLLAPPAGCTWVVEWSSESLEYAGAGTPELDPLGAGWMLPGHAALVYRPEPLPAPQPGAGGDDGRH